MAKKEDNKDPNAGENPVNATAAEKGSYEVIQEFRDIVDFSIVHEVGKDVSNFDPQRLTELVESGLVKQK